MSQTNGVSVANGVENKKPRLMKKTTDSIENGTANGTANGVKHPEEFLDRVFKILVEEGVKKGCNPDTRVVNFEHPKDLQEKLDLDIGDHGEDEDTLVNYCKQTISYSVRTGHPYFFNQLYSGFDQFGLAGSWLSDTVNTSQYTFEVAPVFTLMEETTLQKMRELVGYKEGDGIFCPGGSISNMYGLNLARFKLYPDVKTEGMHALPRLIIFTSEQAHYSIKKGAALLGLGVNNVRQVPCDKKGKMIPAELERMVQEAKDEGSAPYIVNATGGTTVLGSFDPMDDIADICEKYGMWMHVDICWGGGCLLSPKYKHLLKGVERSDSVAWNPHKMMGTPLQCCAFLTKHKDILKDCHCANARYLFQQDKFYDVSFDTGDKSIQCGRKVDVFKLWLMWKAKGNLGFQKGIENAFHNAEYFTQKLKETEGFRLVLDEPECTNVCFWYIPKSLRGQEETKEWWQKLGKVAPIIKQRMVVEGTMLIGYNPLGNLVNFFRLVVSNLRLSNSAMDYVVQEIIRLGDDIVV